MWVEETKNKGNKIFKYFCEKYNPDEVVSYVDRR